MLRSNSKSPENHAVSVHAASVVTSVGPVYTSNVISIGSAVFAGLTVVITEGVADRSFRLMEGSVPIRTSGLVRECHLLAVAAAGSRTSSKRCGGEANGRRPRAAWVNCFSNHTPTQWSWAHTIVWRIPSKAPPPAQARGRDFLHYIALSNEMASSSYRLNIS